MNTNQMREQVYVMSKEMKRHEIDKHYQVVVVLSNYAACDIMRDVYHYVDRTQETFEKQLSSAFHGAHVELVSREAEYFRVYLELKSSPAALSREAEICADKAKHPQG